MRDVAMPYRAVPEERRAGMSGEGFVAYLAIIALTLVTLAMFLLSEKRVDALEQRLAASEACLSNLHITMTRLDNPGPERGAVVASVGC